MTVYIAAIHGFVSALVGLHYGAVQTHSRENTFRASIGQNFGTQLKIGASGGVPAHRARRYSGVSSKLEFVA
jgi:hypothetical protein